MIAALAASSNADAGALEVTLYLGFLAAFVALLIALPRDAPGRRVRNLVEAIVLVGGYVAACALSSLSLVRVTEATGASPYVTLPALLALFALLFLVVEPKLTSRLAVAYPALLVRERAALRVFVRLVGSLVVGLAAAAVTLSVPVGPRSAFALAAGLLFLSGLLAGLGKLGPPTDRAEAWRRRLGIALVVIGMIMTFSGSFGVSFLYGSAVEAMKTTLGSLLFGPLYYLGLPVFLLGMWLLNGRDRSRYKK